MKRNILIFAAITMLIVLAGCTQRTNESGRGHATPSGPVACRTYDILAFTALRDFLTAYMIVTGEVADGDIADLVSRVWRRYSPSSVDEVAAGVNLSALETLYLPIGIPDDFQLHRILVSASYVNIQFLHRDCMISEEAIRNVERGLSQRYFRFSFTRRDLQIPADENPMWGILSQQRACESELIDDRYLFIEPARFRWATHETFFNMQLPLYPHGSGGVAIDGSTVLGIPLDEPHNMIKFNELQALNLRDTQAVLDLLESLPPPTPRPTS